MDINLESLRRAGINVNALRMFAASLYSRILANPDVDFFDFVLPVDDSKQFRFTVELEPRGEELAEPYKAQVNRLAAAILSRLEDEVREGNGAVDIAVRVLLRYADLRTAIRDYAPSLFGGEGGTIGGNGLVFYERLVALGVIEARS